MRLKLKEYLKSIGMTQYQLAKDLGISATHVNHWAVGRTRPNYEYLNDICNTLNCTPNDILEVVPKAK